MTLLLKKSVYIFLDITSDLLYVCQILECLRGKVFENLGEPIEVIFVTQSLGEPVEDLEELFMIVLKTLAKSLKQLSCWSMADFLEQLVKESLKESLEERLKAFPDKSVKAFQKDFMKSREIFFGKFLEEFREELLKEWRGRRCCSLQLA